MDYTNEKQSTKLCTKKTGKVKRTNFWLNPSAEESLANLRRFYSDHLGREVSTSIIVRRSLEALEGHVKSLRFKRDVASIDAEATRIVRHIR